MAEKECEYAKILLEKGLYEAAVRAFESIDDCLSDNYRYFYDYGSALYNLDRFEESIRVLYKGAAISCDPAFHNLMGRSYEAMGDCDNAEREYRHSINMVPCRLYPRALLMNLRANAGDIEGAIQCGRDALKIPVNPLNNNMVNLHSEIQSRLDSLVLKMPQR